MTPMQALRTPSRLMQIVAVAIASAAMTLVIDRLQFRTPLNFIWIFFIPALAGIALNVGILRRFEMTVILPGIALISLMITGQLLGSMS